MNFFVFIQDNIAYVFYVLCAIAVVIVFVPIIRALVQRNKRKAVENKIKDFYNGVSEMTPEEFFEARDKYMHDDIVGVYVIMNVTRKLPYVGQAKRLFFRVNQHLTGHGNGDVYADYKYGDEFTIKLIPLISTEHGNIDKLEKDTIDYYGAYDEGYNRTRGNS